MREMKGFERVPLNPAKPKGHFRSRPDELKYWSTSAGKWVQDAAAFDLWVGSDSLAALHGEFVVVGWGVSG
jgi:hypothetical protein